MAITTEVANFGVLVSLPTVAPTSVNTRAKSNARVKPWVSVKCLDQDSAVSSAAVDVSFIGPNAVALLVKVVMVSSLKVITVS